MGQGRFERRDPAGVFSRWEWTGTSLSIANCRYGFHPLYVRETVDGVSVARSPLDTFLPDERIEIDFEALAVFLALGFFLGDDTPFVGVRQLPPSTVATWAPGGRMTMESAGLPASRAVAVPDRDQAIARYANLFQDAVARQVAGCDGELLVPISGGRDSRHIAFALDRLGAKPSVYLTMREPFWRGGQDVAVAAEVVQALGGKHVVVEQSRALARDCRDIFARMGFCTDEHGWMMPLVHEVNGRAACVADGIAGDILSAGLYQSPRTVALAKSGELAEAAAAIAGEWRGVFGGVADLMPPPVRARMDGVRVIDRIAAELRRHADSPNPIRDFYFWNRTRREMALGPFWLYDGAPVLTPFLDHELWDFLAALPFECVADRGLHTATIRAAYPRFDSIRFEDKGAVSPFAPMSRAAFGWSLAGTIAESTSLALRKAAALRRLPSLVLRRETWWNPLGTLYWSAFAACPHLADCWDTVS